MGDPKIKQKITPTLMLVSEQWEKAEEAINYYISMFHNARIGDIRRYSNNERPDKDGTVRNAAFTIKSEEFVAIDSAHKHNSTFNEAISFVVNCKIQEKIDHCWDRFYADQKAEQCGRLKDKYGLSWQSVPKY